MDFEGQDSAESPSVLGPSLGPGEMSLQDQERLHPHVVLLGIPANDPRHFTAVSKETRADGKAKRSTFACITCHSMKQKCNPTDPNDIYRHPCVRCAKLNKVCQFDLSKRRRRKKRRAATKPGTEQDRGSVSVGTGESSPEENLVKTDIPMKLASFGGVSQNANTVNLSNSGVAVDMSVSPNVPMLQQRGVSVSAADTAFPLAYPMLSATPNQNAQNPNNNNNSVGTGIGSEYKLKQTLQNSSSLLSAQPPSQSSWNSFNLNNPSGLGDGQRLLPKPFMDSATRSPYIPSFNTNDLSSDPNNAPLLLGTGMLSVPSPAGTVRTDSKNQGDISRRQSLKVMSPTLPPGNNSSYLSSAVGSTGPAGSPTNSLSKASSDPLGVNSIPTPSLSARLGQFNEYEQEITNLLSWQKGALESTAAKLHSLATAWDDVVQTSSSVPLYTDPLALGLISEQEAQYYLKLYRETMSKKFHLPLVKVPDHLTIDQLRKTQPILFSSVLSVVSLILPASHKSTCDRLKLDNFVLSLICHHGMRLGNKSTELLRSLLVICLWYNFSEWNNQTRYHLFNYICCSAIRDSCFNGNKFMVMVANGQQNANPDKKGPEDDEDFSRMVLMVYVSGLNISIFLRQPIQLRWSPQFDAFCDGLLKGQYPSKIYQYDDDRTFVVFARINHCLEQIHTHIQLASGMMDNDYISFDNASFIQKMKDTLDSIFPDIPADRHRILAFFSSVYAYLYESILIEFFQSKTMEDKFELTHLPESVEEAFKNCLEKCLATFDYFFQLTPDLISSMPLFHVTRIIYVLGVLLLKIRFGSMTIPAIQHLRSLTVPCISILKRMCEILDTTSSLYPHNNFIVKLRYVCALFSQTYATNIRKYLEKTNTTSDPDINNLFQSNDTSSFFVDSMILENSINSLNDQFWTDMLTNLL